MSLVYRLGKKRSVKPPLALALPKPEPKPELAVVEPEITQPDQTIDTDSDGVADIIDDCNDTSHRLIVNEEGCAVFNGIVEGIEFRTNSSYLTRDARKILDEVATTLNDFPDAQVSISAHTDNWGEFDYNQALSQRRADAVVDYLASRALKRSHLQAESFGESRPIATNKTAAGRAKNRRVEIVANSEAK